MTSLNAAKARPQGHCPFFPDSSSSPETRIL